MYGLLESQFRGYYHRASAAKGKTGENLLQQLELRLDNVVFRMGFADTRAEARQLVRHGHFTVNAKRVNIPSFAVKPGSTVEVADKSKKMIRIAEAIETVDRRGIPQWIEVDKKAFKGTVKSEEEKNRIWDALKTVPTWKDELNAQIDVVAPAAPAAAAAPAAKTYTVQSGDTLSKIAKAHLGDANAYMKIFEANRDKLSDPDKIQVGQVLTIPS